MTRILRVFGDVVSLAPARVFAWGVFANAKIQCEESISADFFNMFITSPLHVLIEYTTILRSKNNGVFEHIEIYFEDKG